MAIRLRALRFHSSCSLINPITRRNSDSLKVRPVVVGVAVVYVCEPMREGNPFLAGDASHTVPPTGAKGLNLALHDVRVLLEGIDSYIASGSPELLDAYSDRALQRIW